ncbi:type II secretion system secretin GspD [Coralloluteibacterium stylophorae]|uniref:Type II secretion system secretin GspD n=1 Tax=Coralloluteibacterium stylophorae TaxID=1776034 RepID=A0AAP2CDJ5_9GAMM|nr:type II secretion system secretin GspD [Coralloluteibacterium stylophorae]MBS7458921.1 type II secretion system secretin GspD [Coralloluteibacterium stylophorae]
MNTFRPAWCLALVLAAPALVHAQATDSAPQALNLQNADIRAFIQDVARATGTTFIVDPRVEGTVTLTSQQDLPPRELLAVLLATLRANGLVAVPVDGGAYRVVPEEGAAQQPGSGASGFRTEVFNLSQVDARGAAESLKPLIGRGGVVVATGANGLLVADYADNIERIRRLIAQVDRDDAAVRTIALRNSGATEIANVIAGLVAPAGTQPSLRTPALTVVPVESSNSLILRGDAGVVARMAQVASDLDVRAETSGDIRVVRLQHATAEDLLPVLQEIVGQPAATPSAQAPQAEGEAGAAQIAAAAPNRRAVIARYPGANALVINASPDMQRTLLDVIRQLDTRREQVLVEALVVEMSDAAAKELGTQLAVAGRDGDVPFGSTNFSGRAPSLLGLAAGASADDIFPDDEDAANALKQAALQSLAGSTGGLLGFGGSSGDLLFGAIINAVKSDTRSNLLSTPSILTLDNEEASILVGQEVPITTGEVLGNNNSNPFRTIQREDVGIQLEVKPQINAGGGITLFLRQEVSAVAGPVSEDFDELVLNKREIETTALVDDGEIVVLGGLLDQNERMTVDKVPGLGDIPGIGALFRNRARERGQTNLMVFIRPRIVRDAGDARALSAERYGYMQRSQPNAELDVLVRQYLNAVPPAPLPADRIVPQPVPDAPR